MNSKPLWWKLIMGYMFFVEIYDILGGGTLAASQYHSTNESL